MGNKELQAKYDEMHKQGSSAWFSDGKEERETILKLGEPWDGLGVLEIGCGEGDLSVLISERGAARILGIDYSGAAIARAHGKHETELDGKLDFMTQDFHKYTSEKYDRLVMQGVLEHLDDPFTELKWMMDNLLGEHGDVITSSPCFLNPRGIVWMTLDMLGAVMSKTDLHYLAPFDFKEFCLDNGYSLEIEDCDYDWGNGKAMKRDLLDRIPKALRDGGISFDTERIEKMVKWLPTNLQSWGANVVYRITK